jgi:hypothetical protein
MEESRFPETAKSTGTFPWFNRQSAQTELQHLRYYQGPINGVLDTGTRRAIAHFQIDNNQHGTGDLDQETAVELGLVRYEEPGGQGRGNGGYGH